MNFVERKGMKKQIKIFYNVYKNKNKPWITFIHGAGGNSAVWWQQLAFFQNNFNVLVLDLRGFGKSHIDEEDFIFHEHKKDIL